MAPSTALSRLAPWAVLGVYPWPLPLMRSWRTSSLEGTPTHQLLHQGYAFVLYHLLNASCLSSAHWQEEVNLRAELQAMQQEASQHRQQKVRSRSYMKSHGGEATAVCDPCQAWEPGLGKDGQGHDFSWPFCCESGCVMGSKHVWCASNLTIQPLLREGVGCLIGTHGCALPHAHVQEAALKHAKSLMQEMQVLEATMAQVETFDRLCPNHRLRLLQHDRFQCSVCGTVGQGWAWRCVTARCADSVHLSCLTGRPP